MSNKRFFHEGEPPEIGQVIFLSRDEASHARTSRIRKGEVVELIDGLGHAWLGGYENEAVRITEPKIITKPEKSAVLAIGLTQGGTFDQIVKQAVELGVSEIIPLKSANAALLNEDRASNKADRWDRIIDEACKQSGQYWRPKLWATTSFNEALKAFASSQNIVASLEPGTAESWSNLPKANQKVLWVGPEGDFTSQEYTALKESNAHFVSLGKTVLRTETAVVAGLALMQNS